MVKDVLTFDSDAFSLEPPLDERGRRYDLPIGDDIAAYLKDRLDVKGTVWKVGDVVEEDFGSVLMLRRDKETFDVTVSWQGGKSWALVFGQLRGCIGWLFDRKPAAKAIQEAKLLVNGVVSAEPERFRNAMWIGNDDFPGIASAFVVRDKSR